MSKWHWALLYVNLMLLLWEILFLYFNEYEKGKIYLSCQFIVPFTLPKQQEIFCTPTWSSETWDGPTSLIVLAVYEKIYKKCHFH